MRLTAAVITVSDSVASGVRSDASGPAVRARLERSQWRVLECLVVSDDARQIAAMLRVLAPGVAAIFTTGGTGITPRDVTPEATRTVLDKELPGFGEQMRLQGLASTPRSILSRGLAGTLGRTLIVNLPGSPRGAVESLEAVLDVCEHAVELLHGNTEHREAEKRETGG